MTIGQSSGTYNFAASQYTVGEMLVESFERCGKKPSELTQQMMLSGRRSLALLLQHMANQGPLLFAIQLLTVQLTQGVTTITLPPYVSSVLDVYVRQFINTTTINQTVSFTTNAGQQSVIIYQPAHGLTVGQSVNIVTQVSVGGLILSGWYQVVNVPDQNDFAIQAATQASSSATNAGQVSSFTTTLSSASVSVNLPNHGLSVGSGFNVPLSTTVGGITLLGSYNVTSVTDANNFVINAITEATSAATASLNGGQVQIQEQTANTIPTDRILTPMSRTDWASQPYKAQQGFPYSYWLDRVQPPTMTFWLTPDQDGPYLANIYFLRQLQDPNLGGGEIPDLQYRALETMSAKLAVKLAVKYAPEKYQMLKMEAVESFTEFSEEDREKVPLLIRPDMSRYTGD